MEHHESRLATLREEIDGVNEGLLTLIQKRAAIVLEIAALKRSMGLEGYDPKREDEMLQHLTARASGPFGATELREIFQSIFRASLDIQDREQRRQLHVRRRDLVPPGGIMVGDVAIGGGVPIVMAGPCSIETPEQM